MHKGEQKLMMKLKSVYMPKLSKYLVVSLLALIPAAAAGQNLKFNFASPV
jgi:hypothetical protein